MSDPLVVSYFTSHYAEDAWRLRESCERFGVEHEIEFVPDFPDWGAATSFKPGFILRKMRQHPGRDVLWLDADCWLKSRRIIDYLTLSQTVSAHVSPLDRITPQMEAWRYVERAHRAKLGIVNSGIVFVPNSETSAVEEWRLRCEMNPNDWDQWHLGLTTHVLPIPDDFRAGGEHVGHESGFHRHWKRKTPRKVALLRPGGTASFVADLMRNGYWIASEGSFLVPMGGYGLNVAYNAAADYCPPFWCHVASRAGSPPAALAIISEAAKANRPLRLLVIGMMPDALRRQVETAVSSTGADVDFLG